MNYTEPALQQVDTNLWAVEYHLYKPGLHIRMRMTLIKLSDDSIWIHSPVPINESLAQEISQLGTVKHIVAPNRSHHLYVSGAKELWPNATLWGAPGLAEKRKDIENLQNLATEKPQWKDTIDLVLIQGIPRMNEVVFFHTLTQSLICSDFLFFIQNEPHTFTRLFWRAFGVWKRFGISRGWRFMTKDKNAMRDSIQKILEWEIKRVIMAHGDIVEIDRENLREVLV